MEFLFSFNVTIIGHNILQFDIDKIVKLVKLQEKNLPKRIVDTLYLHSLVEPGEKSRALSDLVTHTGHNPIEDARASIKLLKQLITKIKQYNLEVEALELLKDNPYLTGIENILLNYFRDSTVSNSEQVIQKTSIRIRDVKTKDLLYVVKNWKGLAEPWSPNILTPRKFKAKSVWEKAAVFSALCALNDIYCGKGDPETFRNTWCIDKNTLKAIVSVSKCYTKRELFEKPVETLPKYISEIEDQFAEVHIVDGDILIPRKTFNRILPKLKKLSSNSIYKSCK
ncbi:MAG: hypothetical protein J7K36_07295 [Archaeoglobaceae archaeon]|nr:hypothetical protein [Archaeoglobaceae archaeon]